MASSITNYLRQRAAQMLWNSIPNNVLIGSAGGAVGQMIGRQALPWYVPSAAPRMAGAYLAVRIVRAIREGNYCQRLLTRIQNLFARIKNFFANLWPGKPSEQELQTNHLIPAEIRRLETKPTEKYFKDFIPPAELPIEPTPIIESDPDKYFISRQPETAPEQPFTTVPTVDREKEAAERELFNDSDAWLAVLEDPALRAELDFIEDPTLRTELLGQS